MTEFPDAGADPTLKKKGLSGCALAALIVGGIVAAGIIVIVLGALWFFTQSEVGIALRETARDAAASGTAPGTDQMRAAGCTTASSLDLSRMAALGRSRISEPEARAELDRMVGVFAVTCESATLSCEEVAAAWGRGAPPAAQSAMVTVFEASGRQRPRCSGRFDRTGAPIPASERPAERPAESPAEAPAEVPADPDAK